MITSIALLPFAALWLGLVLRGKKLRRRHEATLCDFRRELSKQDGKLHAARSELNWQRLQNGIQRRKLRRVELDRDDWRQIAGRQLARVAALVVRNRELEAEVHTLHEDKERLAHQVERLALGVLPVAASVDLALYELELGE